ncbi:PUA-like domain-containing protein [Xylaria arbuscula]|nr:PUA-like domain-containing protein [Xylaria arbuscula]
MDNALSPTADSAVKVQSDAAQTEDAIAPNSTHTIVKIEPEASQTDDALAPATTTADTDTKMDLNSDQTVRVLNMGGTISQKVANMQKQGRSVLTMCRKHRNSITVNHNEEVRKRFADAHLYLDWLETEIEMTPRIKTSTKVDLVLNTLIDKINMVPEELVEKAKELLTKYEAENWGQDLVSDEDPDASSNASPSATAEPVTGVLHVPAANDPIFGTAGIMYGIIVDTSGKRKDYRLRTDLPRKSCKVYGHNDIALGSWYPFQINAIFWGAHGARMAGIAGNVTSGAWSIVIAGTYEDLDTDNGNTLYYSGSNSHENTNPQQAAPASQGTKALHASYRTQNPVRVLRSGGSFKTRNRNPHLPSCGLRYDGLYRVVSFRQRHNKKGGLYDQFKLERLPDQTPLNELQRSSPTTKQVFDRDQL